MIQITENLWISNSRDVQSDFVYTGERIGGVLNVASDLRDWHRRGDEIEYSQVGLVDGPGNEVSDYCAAALALASMVKRHEVIVVYDHDGGRALAVVLVYLIAKESKRAVYPTFMSCRRRWDEVITCTGEKIKPPHVAHLDMFDKIPFGLLEVMM